MVEGSERETARKREKCETINDQIQRWGKHRLERSLQARRGSLTHFNKNTQLLYRETVVMV